MSKGKEAVRVTAEIIDDNDLCPSVFTLSLRTLLRLSRQHNCGEQQNESGFDFHDNHVF